MNMSIVIKYSCLDENTLRIDSEYYSTKYNSNTNFLDRITVEKKKRLDEIANVKGSAFYGSITGDYEKEGMPFIRVSDIKDLNLTQEKMVFLPKGYDKYSSQIATAKPKDVLLTKTGSIGNIAIIQKSMLKCKISRDVLAITPNKEDNIVTSEYLAMLLDSEFGLRQLQRMITLQVQPHLELGMVEKMTIPIPAMKFQKRISTHFQKYVDLKIEYVEKLEQARKLLYAQININPIDNKNKQTFVKSTSSIINGNRIDAEFNHPMYENITNSIKNCKNYECLGNVLKWSKGVEVGKDQYEDAGGISFVRVSDVKPFYIDYIKTKYISKSLYDKLKDDFKTNVGDILLTKDATPGISAIVENNQDQIISSGIIKAKMLNNEYDVDYVILVLNSLLVRMQGNRDSSGSIIKHWSENSIRNTIIPILSSSHQKTLGDLVRKSKKTRKQSIKILDNMRNEVKKEIEQMG